MANIQKDSTSSGTNDECPYPDCTDTRAHGSPHLIEAAAIERRIAKAVKEAADNEAMVRHTLHDQLKAEGGNWLQMSVALEIALGTHKSHEIDSEK